MRILTLCALALFTGIFGVTTASSAQSYPVRSVRIIVPFPPGEAADITASFVGRSRLWGRHLRGDRPRFGDAYRRFLEKYSLAQVGLEDDFVASTRDKGLGREVSL